MINNKSNPKHNPKRSKKRFARIQTKKNKKKIYGGANIIHLTITYPGNNLILTTEPPNELTNADFTFAYNNGKLEQKPDIEISNTVSHIDYLFVMYDPDAPNGINAEDNHNYIHWIFTQYGNMSNKRKTILEYTPPKPPMGTHRYIFKIYNASHISEEELENLKNGGNNIKLPKAKSLLNTEVFFKVNSN